LTLFYDREYARALSIFKELSDKVETMDVRFWYASSAAKVGESELAIKKFKQILDVDPNLHQVRVELATVYLEMGNYDEARSELHTVLEARPSKAVKDNVEKLLAAIDEKAKRLFVNLRGSIGLERDQNVNSGPDGATIGTPLAGIILLTQRDVKLRDRRTGNALYDTGESKEWMWNTTGSFYQSHLSDYHEFGATQFSVTTGPWLVRTQSILKVPVGYARTNYEHDHLFNRIDLSPSYEYFFSGRFSLRGKLSYSQDNYKPAEKWELENDNRIIEISPNFYINNGKDILSFYLSDENLNAKIERVSYDATNMAVSYYKPFERDWDFYLRFKYSKRGYLDPTPNWIFDREDERHSLYMVVSKNFRERYFASFKYNYVKNMSNTALYDYTKHLYGISMGFKY
ncbi:MAG: tetratricopeptide repeat protein, partial [Deltaproteobacteria bacterium]|nr:tetratricopeptide repeat protein [Deltaproteobacteria bacterium]